MSPTDDPFDVADVENLPGLAGLILGPGKWLPVPQSLIDRFADLTGDRHWVHVDRDRARHELPTGRPIAHGLLTLSLLPRLSDALFTVSGASRAINYGSDRIRYVAPVPAESAIRLMLTIADVTPAVDSFRVAFDNEVWTDGRDDRPAMIARTQIVYFRRAVETDC
jgi:acyl dehydratase